MEDINLHFTGDMHALTAAIDTLAALVDNYIYQDNSLNIDPDRILLKRGLDVNDRALRKSLWVKVPNLMVLNTNQALQLLLLMN